MTMIDKKILSRRDITDILAAVLEYNGIKADEFRFVMIDKVEFTILPGETLVQDFLVEVAYEAVPLRVKVQPDPDSDVRIESVGQAVEMVNEWRKKRQTQPSQV